jgi:glycerol-3-phosphate dehydrogenase
MLRKVSALAENREYDLVVIGGGIFGICAAREAALRGLSVAIIERGDFCHATSASCFKMVHGGIRYLQHADWGRIRESSTERNTLLRLAPHLVQPLPITIPTYGHGFEGKEVLCAALSAYGLITLDRNRGIKDSVKRIPLGYLLSKEKCLRQFPGLKSEGLTGAVVIYDGQMYSPSRLALSFLRSATEAGAMAANYVEVTGFLQSNIGKVFGVTTRDVLSGETFEVRARIVLNASGPWAERLLIRSMGLCLQPPGTYSRDAYFVVGKRLTGNSAIAVKAKTRDPDAILSRQGRHLFLVPWRNYTLVGVWHKVYKGHPEACTVSEQEIQEFIDEINYAYPALTLNRDDVLLQDSGLVLFGDNEPGAVHLSYGKRSRLVDHFRDHGIQGLITLIGVRYTTARGEASKAVDLVINKLGPTARHKQSFGRPVFGGDIDSFEEFMQHGLRHPPRGLGIDATRALLHNYGSQHGGVLKYADENPEWIATLGMSTVTKAEVVHAVREEMAQKLEDVVFRRTELGTAGYPGREAIADCAHLMASELGWDTQRLADEVQQVDRSFALHGAMGGCATDCEEVASR